MKIIVYDEETTGLDATKDILVHSYKWIGRAKVYTLGVDDYTDPCNHGFLHYDEEPLIKDIHKNLGEAEAMVTFNGKNFDYGILQTKFMYYRLPPLADIPHIDLYQVAKTKMRLPSKSLRNIAKYLKLKHQKMELPIEVWNDAANGDKKAINLLHRRAASDVLITEELYLDHLRPYVRLHPRINGYDGCKYCGKKTLQRHGRVASHLKTPQYRFDCLSCGGHENRSLTKEEKDWYGTE